MLASPIPPNAPLDVSSPIASPEDPAPPVDLDSAICLGDVIDLYLASADYRALRPRTQFDYQVKLVAIRDQFGTKSLAALDDRQFTRAIFNWREEARETPRVADYRLQVLKLVLSWARRRGLVDHNRATRMGQLYRSKRRLCSWSDDQIAAFKAVAPPHMQLALALALETGQRQADLLDLDWSAVEGDLIHITQQKTGVDVAVPISAKLRTALDAYAVSREGAVLRRADGAHWDSQANGFRNSWRKICQRAGVVGVTFHDLRGTFITRRLADGWTTLEVALCTGHSLRDLAMLDVYADRKAMARRTAGRLLERVGGVG